MIRRRSMLRIGIDTGGTFTDVAVPTARGVRIHKVPSTPDDPGRAVLEGLLLARAGRTDVEVDLVHGTTVGLNAMLTGRLARTALVTNDGFLDLCEIGRQSRSDIYDLHAARAELPVPRRLRFGVASRRDADGAALLRPSAEQLDALCTRLARARVEAVAIGLLHSYAHPDDEHRIARALGPLGVPVTCSADLLPVHGEYERFAAAVLNAAIQPILGAYLGRLRSSVEPGRLRLLRSSGGVMAAGEATRFPARAVFSGPAGGVQAAQSLARALGEPRAAALDMGGTSTDVALVQPAANAAPRDVPHVAGLPLALPALDVHTVGCGGGSVAYADAGGALRVGPRSAGAEPGPACYGTGEEPTVTDAHMALGHLGADTLLGGDFPVEPDRSVRAIEQLAHRLGLRPSACAHGILEIAEVAMMRALLRITVERAVDPQGLPLIAYGGAGGLHAAHLTSRLGMSYALVPRDPGAFSAVGLALAGETQEAVATVLRPLDAMPRRTIDARLRRLGRAATERLEDRASGRVTVRCAARLRYVGQGQGLWIPAARGGLDAAFARAHRSQFGFAPQDVAIELVELRAVASLAGRRLPRHRGAVGMPPRGGAARPRRGPLGRAGHTVHRRSDLPVGRVLDGPCLIEEQTAVTRVPAGFRARIDPLGIVVEPTTPTARTQE